MPAPPARGHSCRAAAARARAPGRRPGTTTGGAPPAVDGTVVTVLVGWGWVARLIIPQGLAPAVRILPTPPGSATAAYAGRGHPPHAVSAAIRDLPGARQPCKSRSRRPGTSCRNGDTSI